MVTDIPIFVTGILAWTFVEYLIHAWLSHTFRTFATPFHDAHHHDPHLVFAVGAWLPVAVTWVGGLLLFGWASGMIFYTGMAVGFAVYEWMHYRVHFAAPSSSLEAYLRSRHLAHHYCDPNACFGVTSELWDLIFGTEVLGDEKRKLTDAGAGHLPLEGPTNFWRLLHFGTPATR